MIEYKKDYCYEIIQDDFAESPDDWGDEEVFLVYDHRSFSVKREGFNPEDIYNHLNILRGINHVDMSESDRNELREQLEEYYPYSNEYYIFPVYMYLHSGIILSLGNTNYPFNDRFDTSMKGYILVSMKSDLNAQWAAENLIETWNQYLSGEVYYYNIYKKEKCLCCGHTEYINIDSCGGYFGENECENEAKLHIDSLINKEKWILKSLVLRFANLVKQWIQ